jgi:hypothetical protein
MLLCATYTGHTLYKAFNLLLYFVILGTCGTVDAQWFIIHNAVYVSKNRQKYFGENDHF